MTLNQPASRPARLFHGSLTYVLAMSLILVSILSWSNDAWGVAYSSVADGDWDGVGPDTWAPSGVPGIGDSITINASHDIRVDSTFSFGDGSTTSFQNGTGSNIFLDGVLTQLTHVAGSTFVKNSNFDTRITGTGTFVNDGRHELEKASGSFGLLLYNSSPTYTNNGDFVFTESDSRLNIGYGAGDTALFQNNGTVEVAVGASGFATIQPGLNNVISSSQFQTTNPITFTSGALVFSPPNVTSITDANFTSFFGPNSSTNIGATSELRIAGELTDINLTAAGIGAGNLARVSISHDSLWGRALVAHPSGTTINVAEADGGILFNSILTASASTINIPSGRTVTNAAGSMITGGRNTRILGDGTFQNDGRFDLVDYSSFGLLIYNGSPTFINDGTFNMTTHNMRLEIGYTGTDDPQFQNNGTFNVALGSNTNTAFIVSDNAAVAGNFTATNPISFTQGILVFGPQGRDTYNDAAITELFGSVTNPNTELRLVGTLKNINFTAATDLSRIRLSHSTGMEGVTAHADGLTIDVPEAIGGISMNGIFTAPAATITVPTGRTATNAADSLIVMGRNSRIIGDGTFVNNGKVQIDDFGGGFGLLMYNGSPTFNNSGEFEFLDSSAELTVGWAAGDSPIFNNLAGGVVRTNLPSGANVALVNVDNNRTGTFNNSGIVEVLSGTMRFESSITVPAVTGGGTSLDSGQWHVKHTGNAATLDIQAGGTSPGSIDTIGSAAKVLLSGASPQFIQLSSASLNVDGTFAAHDSQIYGLTGNLNMGTGGVLEFGLQGLDEGGTLTTGIQVVGSVSFDDTQIDVIDLGGVGLGTYRIMEFASATGLAVLGNSPGGYNFALVQGVDFLELTVSEIPEPSSLLLLSLGALGLVRNTRRRMSKA